MEIKHAKLEDLNPIVDLHKEIFKGVFSGELNREFLLSFYKELLTDNDCAIYVANIDNKFAGFIAGSGYGNYLSFKMKCKLMRVMIHKCIRTPEFIVEILRLVKKKLYYIILKIKSELIAIAVKSEYRKRKIGRRLVENLEDFFIKKKIKSYHVFTDNKVSKGLDFYFFLKFKKIASVELFGYSGTFLKKFL